MRHIILGSLLAAMSFQPLAAQVKYICEEGGSLRVDYATSAQGTSQASLQWVNGDSIMLLQQVAASGVLYANEQWQWHTKGWDATLQQAGQDAVLKCHQIDQATILEDKASWVRFVYPPNWDQESVNATFWSGPDAAMREPGAEYFIGFDYLPQEAEMPQAFLGRVMVFPRAAWDWVSKQVGGAGGEVLAETPARVFVLAPAQPSPYPPDSLDAHRFRNLQLSPEAWKAQFSVLPPTQRSAIKTVTGAVSYRQRMAIPSASIVRVQLRNRAGKLLAEQQVPSQGHQVPLSFSINIDPALLETSASLFFSAQILSEGKTLFKTDKDVLVNIKDDEEITRIEANVLLEPVR